MLAAEYATRGYCALRGVLDAQEIELLREDAHKLLAALHERGGDLFEESCVLEPVPAGIPEDAAARTCFGPYLELREARHTGTSARLLESLLLSKLPSMAAAIGAHNSFLFNEHHVVKPTGETTSFRWHTVSLWWSRPLRWHSLSLRPKKWATVNPLSTTSHVTANPNSLQDAAHQLEAIFALQEASSTSSPVVQEEVADYTSVWCALDDIDSSNGALLLLPQNVPQPPLPWYLPANDVAEQWLHEEGRSFAVLAAIKTGDVVVFSSRLWHCSEPNLSGMARHAYYVQYAEQAIGGESPISLAIPTAFLTPACSIAFTPIVLGHALRQCPSHYDTDVENET